MFDCLLKPSTEFSFLSSLLLTGRFPGVSFECPPVAHLILVVYYHFLAESNAVIGNDIRLCLHILFGRATDAK